MRSNIFVNVSNHTLTSQQVAAAKELAAARDSEGELIAEGRIISLPFPNIPPSASAAQVHAMAEALFREIVNAIEPALTNDPSWRPTVVHLMGEQSFCFALTCRLLSRGFRVVVSCTERLVREEEGKKISEFRFAGFRLVTVPRSLKLSSAGCIW